MLGAPGASGCCAAWSALDIALTNSKTQGEELPRQGRECWGAPDVHALRDWGETILHERGSLGPDRNRVVWRTGQYYQHSSDHGSLVVESAHIHSFSAVLLYCCYFRKQLMHLDGLKIRMDMLGSSCPFAAINNTVWIHGPDIILYVGRFIRKVKFQKWDC